jgi:transposase
MVKRRSFTDQFKAKVALEALRGDKTIQEIAAKHQVHPNQVLRNRANSRSNVNKTGRTSICPDVAECRNRLRPITSTILRHIYY